MSWHCPSRWRSASRPASAPPPASSPLSSPGRLHRSLPGSLLAVVVATVVAETASAETARIGTLPSSLPLPALPELTGLPSLLGPAAVVAFLAGLESMSDPPRHDPDRELFGQGLANVASGFFGGMPATGAIARTAVNARAGAHTRVAAVSHALVPVAVVYAGSGLVARIPLAALAGVLVVTAWRMVEGRTVLSVVRSTPGDAAVFAATAVATVALDLIAAVQIGLGLAGVAALAHLAGTARAVPEPAADDGVDDDAEHALLAAHVLTCRLDGPLFFAAAARFLADITDVADVRVVILRLSGVGLLDATGARVLGDVVQRLGDRGITVLLKGASPEHTRLLHAVGTLAPVADRGHVFAAYPEALAHARAHIAGQVTSAPGPPARSSTGGVAPARRA